MAPQEVLDLAHSTPIFLGQGLNINFGGQGRVDDGGFVPWTKTDVVNALHAATAASRASSDAWEAWYGSGMSWWMLSSSLPAVGNVSIDAYVNADKTITVNGMSLVKS